MKAQIQTLRELYRVDNKYWATGDVDILEKRRALAKEIDERFYYEICVVTHIATQKHFPVKKLAEVLKMLEFEIEEAEDGQR